MSTTQGFQQAEPVGPAPALDPELRDFVEATWKVRPDTRGPSIIEDIRAIAAEPVPAPDLTLDGAYRIQVEDIPSGIQGVTIPLAVCRPTAPAQGDLPALHFAHGGGMVAGNSRTGLPYVLRMARPLGAVVFSVDYRLAPEHPYPAAVDDCTAALAWVLDHAGEFGADADRVVAVGGSAGGGITAGSVLRTRDEGGRLPRGQMLLNAMLDDRNDTLSARQMEGVDPWDRAANLVGWNALLGAERGGPLVSPYASPARAEDLSGLPATYLSVGSVETFRDENVRYANRIWQAGGDAELHVWPGGFHGFDGAVPDAALSRDSRAAAANWLRRVLG